MECEAWYDIPCHLSNFGDWLITVLLWFPRKIFELLLDGLAAVIEAFPALDALSVFASNAAALGSLSWLLDVFAVREGVALIMGALILRFLLRRIPFIG